MNNEKIINSIKALCSKYEITMGQLEKSVGLSQGLVSKWKDKTPSLDKIIDIADYFNVPLDEVIGRELKTKKDPSEDLISILYNLTRDENISWEDRSKFIPQMELDEDYYLDDDGFNNRELFVSLYNEGSFWLYCQYDEEKGVITDYFVQLYIKPDSCSKCVLQEVDEAKAFRLWLYIHTNMYGTIDEIKAENLKDDFINSKTQNLIDSCSDEQIQQIAKNIIEIDPQILKVLDIIKTPEFLKLQQILNSSQLQKTLKSIKESTTPLSDIN